MKKVKITAVRKACYPSLMEKYENPIRHACVWKKARSGSRVAGQSPRAATTAG